MPDPPSTDELRRALLDPGAYTHAPERVTLLQTHGSMLFFAGDRVYKVKKPVDFGFMNFTTLRRRRFYCEEEVRLNRRMAARVYLGVAPITRSADGRIAVRGEGEVIEHAVEMRRLPAERMLDALLEAGQAEEADLDAIADRVVAFHADARADDSVRAFGEPDAVARRRGTNLEECAELAGDLPDAPDPAAPALSRAGLDRLRRWSEDEQSRLRQRIADRAAGGRVREGHGDLHAGNICLLQEGGQREVVAYDCIEFEESFRCLDVAAEIAFLAMDLERRGFVEAARRVVDRYARVAHDEGLRELQALYRCHYACVRGKVAALRARGEQIAREDAEASWRQAVDTLHLAAGYTLPASLVVMCGLPGTGKSWWAARISRALRARLVRSDEVRKAMAGMDPLQRPSADAERERLYAPEMTRRVYERMASIAAQTLALGQSVVLDATSPTKVIRTALLEAGRGAGAALIAHCVCPEEVVHRRLLSRAERGGDASDADIEVHRAARERFEPPEEGVSVTTLAGEEAAWRGVERVIARIGSASPIVVR